MRPILSQSARWVETSSGALSTVARNFIRFCVTGKGFSGASTPGHLAVFVDTSGLEIEDGGPVPTATGTVTHTGALTDHAVIVGNGGADISALSSLGSSGQVLTSQGAGLDPQWAAAAVSGITQLTGDGTAGPGSGSQALTLATVNGNVGSFGNATTVGTFTVNGKGLITAAADVSITFPTPAVDFVPALLLGGM